MKRDIEITTADGVAMASIFGPDSAVGKTLNGIVFSFANETPHAQIIKMITETTQDMTKRDTAAFLTVLEGEGIFGPIGVVGYCMGEGRARPQRLPIPIVSWLRQASTAATSPAKDPIVRTGLPVR